MYCSGRCPVTCFKSYVFPRRTCLCIKRLTLATHFKSYVFLRTRYLCMGRPIQSLTSKVIYPLEQSGFVSRPSLMTCFKSVSQEQSAFVSPELSSHLLQNYVSPRTNCLRIARPSAVTCFQSCVSPRKKMSLYRRWSCHLLQNQTRQLFLFRQCCTAAHHENTPIQF